MLSHAQRKDLMVGIADLSCLFQPNNSMIDSMISGGALCCMKWWLEPVWKEMVANYLSGYQELSGHI